MKVALQLLLVLALSLALLPGCADKKGDEKKGEEAAAKEEGPNPFQIRKDSVEAYMKAVEDAPDLAAAEAAGQAWLDANLETYKKNCELLNEYAADLEKSKMGKGIETPFDEYMTRLNTKAGDPMKVATLATQFNSFFNCMVFKQ